MDKAPLVTGEFYHLFNRANSHNDKLFYQDRNYRYFLQKWEHYLGRYLEIWCYCLIPNHFHFLVRVKENDNHIIMQSWRKFSIGYTLAINKQEKRRGSLFQEHPKRLHIKSDAHLLELIRYIHNNPVHHSLTTKPEQWQYSSYRAMLCDTHTRVERTKVFHLFGDVNTFIQFHKQSNSHHNIEYCVVE
jgi:REP element-mobilizing transposase RayT